MALVMNSKESVWVSAIGVHPNGFKHWKNGQFGQRKVTRTRNGKTVSWKGKRTALTEEDGKYFVFLDCKCKWGEEKDAPIGAQTPTACIPDQELVIKIP